ncbi:TNF receptor-associated factor 2-like [Montipora foliosa]|uniref:TNF receptor-associated factor 2-like n=1 Tax=Montipora foliosa TaxID=591990 RepID=UPI0035F15B5E
MPGYNLAPVDRLSIDERNLCPKCAGILKEAVQAIACGHRYCKTCVDMILSDEVGKCVIDGSVILKEQVFLDRFVEREIQSLLVHCENHEQGCQWEGELRKREAHYPECKFVPVPCVHQECGQLVTRTNLAEHLETVCQYRMEKCDYCESPVVYAAMKEHQDTECPSVPITCPECHKEGIPRVQMSAHIDPMSGDCEEMQLYCPLKQIGCSETKMMKLQERKLHEETNTAGHLALLFQTVMQLFSIVGSTRMQESNHMTTNDAKFPSQKKLERFVKQVEDVLKENREMKSKLSKQEERIQHLESTRQHSFASSASYQDTEVTTELSRKLNNEEAKIADLELLIVEGNKISEQLQRQVWNVAERQDAFNGTATRLQREIESMSHSLALRNVMMSDLNDLTRQQPVTSYDGVLIWKISDLARKRQDAISGRQVSLYSPCFYTGRYGYKMCARIYLNGDGMGKGTHISLFFAVMRGEYDALLRWPFRQKVTFMLLDQNNVEHVIDSFKPDPNSSSFQRPRRETNIPSGCPMFCPLSEFNNHAYVMDDAMFLKVIVDTTDL